MLLVPPLIQYPTQEKGPSCFPLAGREERKVGKLRDDWQSSNNKSRSLAGRKRKKVFSARWVKSLHAVLAWETNTNKGITLASAELRTAQWKELSRGDATGSEPSLAISFVSAARKFAVRLQQANCQITLSYTTNAGIVAPPDSVMRNF